MALNTSIKYNGVEKAVASGSSISIVYPGATIAPITAPGTKTLNVVGKLMQNDIVVGNKTLHTSGCLMHHNIVLESVLQQLATPTSASLSGTTASVSPVEHATGYTVVETVGGSDVIVSEYTAPQYEYTIDPNTLMMKVTTAPYTIETGGILKI